MGAVQSFTDRVEATAGEIRDSGPYSQDEDEDACYRCGEPLDEDNSPYYPTGLCIMCDGD